MRRILFKVEDFLTPLNSENPVSAQVMAKLEEEEAALLSEDEDDEDELAPFADEERPPDLNDNSDNEVEIELVTVQGPTAEVRSVQLT